MIRFIFSVLFSVFSIKSSATIYTTEYLWDKRELTVCFASENEDIPNGPLVLKFREWKESHKRKIQKWVQSEYTEERTGIHFVGFEDCQDNPFNDVAVFYNKNSKVETLLFGGLDGIASLGTTLKFARPLLPGYPHISAYVSISKSGIDKGTVIHEFGHTAGLMHEHEHPDALRFEPDCRYTDWGHNMSGFNYESYDRDSVMNYCKLERKGGRKAGLSIQDVETLKKIYL